MNSSTPKKRARDLQAITGMPYQSAHRAVTEGAEFKASIRSAYTLGDFVTRREMRIWLQVNSGKLRCAEDRHWMPTERLGQCVGCGGPMATFWDHEGNEYEHPSMRTSASSGVSRSACTTNGLRRWRCSTAPPRPSTSGATGARCGPRTTPWSRTRGTSWRPLGVRIRSVRLPTLEKWK